MGVVEAENWAHYLSHFPDSWVPPGINRDQLREFLTARSSGRVLETMAGFNSYFNDATNIDEVVALDFCNYALSRYPYQNRRKIVFDLEMIGQGEHIDIPDGYFKTIGCFGAIYLREPALVFTEFNRLLSTDGKLLVVGGPNSGWQEMITWRFDAKRCEKFMRKAGFSTKVERINFHLGLGGLNPMLDMDGTHEHYLVEGTKV